MALVDDQVSINTQDSGQEADWTATGHTGVNLNDSTSQVPIYREGANCGDGQLNAQAGTYDDDIASTAINNGIRADKLYVIWLWMTSNVTIDATTDILVGIADAIGWTGDGGLWNMRPLFQSVDRGGWQPCAVYPTQPDQTIGTFGNLAKGAILSQRIDIDNAAGSQVRLFGIEASFFISYIGGHSQTVTLDNLVSHSKDKTNNRDSGMINSLGASYRSQVVIRLGDAAATALTTFFEKSKIIHFDNFNTDHEIGWDFINDTGGDLLDFQLGDFLGGAPVSGMVCFWNSGASAAFVGQDFCDKFRLYAGTFSKAGPVNLAAHIASRGVVADLVTIGSGGTGYTVGDDLTGVSGTGTKATFNVDAVASGVVTAVTMLTEGNYTVDPTNADTTTVAPTGGTGATLNYTLREFTECKGYTFDTCGEVDIGDITFEDNTILNAVSGVLYAGTGTRRTKNNKYIGCTDGVHFDTAQTVSMIGDKFAGNTTDIHFSGTGTLTINASGGANPVTSRVSGGGTVVINNNKSVTFNGMLDDTEVRVFKTSDDSAVDGIENVTAGTVDDRSFTWSASAGLDVYYRIHNVERGEFIEKRGFIVPTNDVSIDIDQRAERNFNDPV
ncbi:MAG: hypothetical protein ABGX83_05535 [Nitrospira sp.]